MRGMKAATTAIALSVLFAPAALAGDGWRVSLGSRFGLDPFHRERAPLVVRDRIIIRPVVCAPSPVPVHIERCDSVLTSLTQNVRIDGRTVQVTLVLWRESGEIRSKAIFGAEGCDVPFIRDASFTIEQGRRSWTTDMDPAGGRVAIRDRRVEFASDAALGADPRRGFDASLAVRTRHGTETVRWCDVRVN